MIWGVNKQKREVSRVAERRAVSGAGEWLELLIEQRRRFGEEAREREKRGA